MPIATDFRRFAFDNARIERSGRSVGGGPYWRLYTVENLLRILVHSVLSPQLGPDWFSLATTTRMRADAAFARERYLARPHGLAGDHLIYFTNLSGLSKIMSDTRNQFVPVIPDIDSWIARLELILVSRNIVGHMNWPTKADKNGIEEFYRDLRGMIGEVHAAGFPLTIPA